MLRLPRDRRRSCAHERSPRQERELSSRLGGEVVRGSGCGSRKGDVRVKGRVLIECKVTTKGSFRVTKGMIDKIEAEAMGQAELPVVQIEFQDPDSRRITHRVCVVPEYVLELLQRREP